MNYIFHLCFQQKQNNWTTKMDKMDMYINAFKKTFPNADTLVVDASGKIFPIKLDGKEILVRFHEKLFHRNYIDQGKCINNESDDDSDNEVDSLEDIQLKRLYGWGIVPVLKVSVNTLKSFNLEAEVSEYRQTLFLRKVPEKDAAILVADYQKRLSKKLTITDSIKILPESYDSIEYELYPMNQGYEFGLSSLNYKEIEPVIVENFNEMQYFYLHINKIKFTSYNRYIINDNLNLYIGSAINDNDIKDHKPIYVLIDNDGHFLSGFIDNSYNFQEGDCETRCYYYCDTGTIAIENDGDVSSIVIIKGL